jgi:hypothetical protein
MKSLNPQIQKELDNLESLELKINEILIDWDPVGVKTMEGFEESVYLEYLKYIPEIKRYLENGWDLSELIDDLEENRIGYLNSPEEKRREVVKALLGLVKV